MAKLKTTFAAAALAAVLFGSLWNGLRSQPKTVLSLREELSIGSLDDEALFQWTGLAVDGAGNIYVLDMMDCSLKKFDRRGRLLGKTGRKGQGPGEFLLPTLLDCTDRFVYASDQGTMGIMIFDPDLKYLRTIRTPSLVSHFAVLAEGRFAVQGPSMGADSAILVLDDEGRTIDELPLADGKSGWLRDSASFAGNGKGGLLIAFLFQDRVEKWTGPASRQWRRSYFGNRPVRTEKIAGLDLPSETCFKDVAVDSRGLIYLLGGNRAERSGRDILVLDGSGVLLQTLTLPEPSHCLTIDRKDRLYVRANEGVTIKRYEIRHD